MISFHPVSEKQKHPTAKKKSRAPNPLHEKKKDDSRKNHGDADGMQQLVRGGFVFVIVLCHVVRQAWHVAHLPAAGCVCQIACGDFHVHVDFIPNMENFLESPGTTKSFIACRLLRALTRVQGNLMELRGLGTYDATLQFLCSGGYLGCGSRGGCRFLRTDLLRAWARIRVGAPKSGSEPRP